MSPSWCYTLSSALLKGYTSVCRREELDFEKVSFDVNPTDTFLIVLKVQP